MERIFVDPQFRMRWPWALPILKGSHFQTAAGGSASADPKVFRSKQEIHRKYIEIYSASNLKVLTQKDTSNHGCRDWRARARCHKARHILAILTNQIRVLRDSKIQIIQSSHVRVSYISPKNDLQSYGWQTCRCRAAWGIQLIHDCRSAMWIWPPEVCQVPLPCSFGILSARRIQKENIALAIQYDTVLWQGDTIEHSIPVPICSPPPKMAKVLPWFFIIQDWSCLRAMASCSYIEGSTFDLRGQTLYNNCFHQVRSKSAKL